MPNMLPLVVFLIIATPIAWFASEFQERRWLRLSLGSLALAMCYGVAYLVGSLQMWNANAWYGFASKKLVDTAITELEAGHADRVLTAFKALKGEFSPTYESRARYDELVDDAVAVMQVEPFDAGHR